MSYSFIFKNINQIERFPAAENALWIFNADKIPPHIGLKAGEKYFSLKWNGKDVSEDPEKIWRMVQQKKIPFLSVGLKGIDLNLKEVTDVFDRLTSAKFHQFSCLMPINNLLFPGQKGGILKDLLLTLETIHGTLEVEGIYLPDNYKGILEYDAEQILAHINQY